MADILGWTSHAASGVASWPRADLPTWSRSTCDVKLSNVLIIRDEDPALIESNPARESIYKALLRDFGTSRAIEELPSGYTTQTRCGTAGYRAPELWTGGKPTLEGDFYAYGGLILKVRCQWCFNEYFPTLIRLFVSHYSTASLSVTV